MKWPTLETEQQNLLRAFMFKQLNEKDTSALQTLIAQDEDVAMQNDVFRLDIIDSYLRKEMNAETLTAFEQVVKSDAELQEEIEFNKMLNTTLGNPEITAIQSMLAELEEAPIEVSQMSTAPGTSTQQNNATPLRAVKSKTSAPDTGKRVELSFWQKNKSWLSIAAMLVILALPMAYFLSGPSASASFADNFKSHQIEHFRTIESQVKGNMGFAGNQIKKDLKEIKQLMSEKKWKDASAACDAFSTKYPDQREALLIGAIADLQQSNGDAAMKRLRTYEQGNALQPSVMYYKAWAFWTQGKKEEAQALFHTLAKGNSDYAADAAKMASKN